MKKKRKLRPWVKVSLVIILILIIPCFIDDTYSRYFHSLINSSDLQLAPWKVTINNQKVNSKGDATIVVEPVITSVTTNTNTYKNKIVPGCSGYFDVVINPAGTGVAIDYTIDFQPTDLPGGMVYTSYETLDESNNVIATSTTFPSDFKLNGTMQLVGGNILDESNILRYRIYWNYLDDDTLNITAPTIDNQYSAMINIKLKQSIS